ncbi:MAG: PBECR2 nuclease fold domain-containing protein [Saprospiraceae bacterium]|nr:PBECR2 nuclease fold domain-containing protein [Saprospiraceae bacterium]
MKILFLLKSVIDKNKRLHGVDGRFESGADSDIPEPNETTDKPLNDGLGERFYLSEFMREFGARWDETVEITDLIPYRRLVSKDLFIDHKTSSFKILKEKRAGYVRFIAKTIKSPDEVWIDAGGHGDRTMYCLSRYRLKDGVLHIITAFKEKGSKKGSDSAWIGWSGYQSKSPIYYQEKRAGERIYRKP